jgi:hypothetical protein
MVAAARAAAVALPLPLPGFKRAPGPVFRPRPRPVPEAPRERETQQGGLARRAGRIVVSLPDHPWLDRVVRGRVWIPLLGVLLAGIVASQVEILKLGASMGRSLEQTSTLTNRNEQLRGTVAALSDDQRIQRLASAMGLVLPPAGAVGYLRADRDGNVGRALANIHTPDSSAFVTMAANNGALVTGPNTSTLPPTPGAPTPPPATTSSTPTTSTATSTSTAPSTSTGTSSDTTTSTSTDTTTGSDTATSPQTTTAAPTTSEQTATPADTTTSQPSAQTTPTQTPATGAAAIGPSSTQSSSGG